MPARFIRHFFFKQINPGKNPARIRLKLTNCILLRTIGYNSWKARVAFVVIRSEIVVVCMMDFKDVGLIVPPKDIFKYSKDTVKKNMLTGNKYCMWN